MLSPMTFYFKIHSKFYQEKWNISQKQIFNVERCQLQHSIPHLHSIFPHPPQNIYWARLKLLYLLSMDYVAYFAFCAHFFITLKLYCPCWFFFTTKNLVYLQFGHVACSSFRRESARRWIKQPAHIKCPLVHCIKKAHQKCFIENCRYWDS